MASLQYIKGSKYFGIVWKGYSRGWALVSILIGLGMKQAAGLLLLILFIRGFYKPQHYKREKPSGSKRYRKAAAQEELKPREKK